MFGFSEFTSIDLLVVAFMILATVSLLSVGLMFIIRNRIAQRIFFYSTTAFTLYLSYVGLYIGIAGFFTPQIVAGVVVLNLALSAVALQIFSRGSKRLFLIARIVSAAALIGAFFTAFC